MTRPVYSFRPNLKNPEHKKAWEKFQSVLELNICGGAEQSGTNPLAEDIPDQMMDFLSQMENM